jgi:hypothetical protein
MGEKSFQQWLEEFKTEIKKGYENATMATALSEHAHKELDKEPTTLPKIEREPRTLMGFEGVQMVEMKFTFRNVKPLDAGFVLNLGEWSKNPEGMDMDMFMNDLGKDVAMREYEIIVNGMKNCTGTTNTIKAKQKGKLSIDDIREAQSHTEGYADSVIMNHQQEAEFLISGQIRFSFVPKERRGYKYCGMIGDVKVYGANFTKDFALVFDRSEIIFASTPLEIAFDNMDNPKQLILHKMCVAAPMSDQAVAKIELV